MEEPCPQDARAVYSPGRISRGQGSGTKESRGISDKPNTLSLFSLFRFNGHGNLRGGAGELKKIKVAVWKSNCLQFCQFEIGQQHPGSVSLTGGG